MLEQIIAPAAGPDQPELYLIAGGFHDCRRCHRRYSRGAGQLYHVAAGWIVRLLHLKASLSVLVRVVHSRRLKPLEHSMLEARSLTKYYNHTPAVRNISFSIG